MNGVVWNPCVVSNILQPDSENVVVKSWGRPRLSFPPVIQNMATSFRKNSMNSIVICPTVIRNTDEQRIKSHMEGPYGGLGVKPNFVQFGNDRPKFVTNGPGQKQTSLFSKHLLPKMQWWRAMAGMKAPFLMPIAQCDNKRNKIHVAAHWCAADAVQNRVHSVLGFI